jgi:hypothetical protein
MKLIRVAPMSSIMALFIAAVRPPDQHGQQRLVGLAWFCAHGS